METGKIALNMRLKRKWDEKMQYEHRDRIQSITRMIDNNKPPSYRHMETKPKKVIMEEERFEQIQHDNRILMQKMANIIQNKETFRKWAY